METKLMKYRITEYDNCTDMIGETDTKPYMLFDITNYDGLLTMEEIQNTITSIEQKQKKEYQKND